MKIDIELLLKEVEAKRVSRQKHPNLPLWIYKYSEKNVYDKTWNPTNLLCRGLVVDGEGNIVSNVMPKFFNDYEYIEAAPQKVDRIKQTTKKLDGSLINIATWKDNLIVSSSGSFTSPQALRARRIIEKENYQFDDGGTYVCEVIYPENRIVLDYGNLERLVLVAKRDTKTGVEENIYNESERFYKARLVDKTFEELLAEKSRPDFINEEGFVVQSEDGSRLKVKYDEYMKRHKLLSGMNEKFVWEILKDKMEVMDLVNMMPPDVQQWVGAYMIVLKESYRKVENEAAIEFDLIKSDLPSTYTRKDFALKALSSPNSGILFSMLDKEPYEQHIWKKLRPVALKRFGMGEDWEV